MHDEWPEHPIGVVEPSRLGVGPGPGVLPGMNEMLVFPSWQNSHWRRERLAA